MKISITEIINISYVFDSERILALCTCSFFLELSSSSPIAAFSSSFKSEMLLPERPSLTALSIHRFISYHSVSLMIFNALYTILPLFYTLFVVYLPLPKCKIHENKTIACLFHYIPNFKNTDVLVYSRNLIKGCHMDECHYVLKLYVGSYPLPFLEEFSESSFISQN